MTRGRSPLVGVGAPVNAARAGAAVDLGARATRSGRPAAQPSGLASRLPAAERVLQDLQVGVEGASEVLTKAAVVQAMYSLNPEERRTECERQTETLQTIAVFGPCLSLPCPPHQIITNLVVSKTIRLSSSGLAGQKCDVDLARLKSRCEQTAFLCGEAEGRNLCPCVFGIRFLAAAGLGAPFFCGCPPRAVRVCSRPRASSRILGSSGSFRPGFCLPQAIRTDGPSSP